MIDVDIDQLLNECTSRYLSRCNDKSKQSMSEYSWIHDLNISNYASTANQLFCNVSSDEIGTDLMSKKVNFSMAALSVFVNEDADDVKNEAVDIETVQKRLVWINAKSLLRSYDPAKYQSENVLKRMSESEIIGNLIRVCLQNERRLNLQNIKEIVSLIALSDSALIVDFIQSVIDCNKSEWQTIDAMLDP